MRNLISRIFGTKSESQLQRQADAAQLQSIPGTRTPGTHAPPKPDSSLVANQSAAPVYPPSDPGIQYVGPDALIASQFTLIKELKLLVAEESAFNERFMPVIRRLAQYIDLLPATQVDHYQGAGGLFRLCLEMGYNCLKSSEGRIFASQHGLEERRRLEVRWRYASFLSGLLVEVYRPLTDMIVVAANGAEWPAYQTGIGRWLAQIGSDRYFVRWLPKPRNETGNRASAAFVVAQVVPTECLEYLREGSPAITSGFLAVAAGTVPAGENSVLGEVINAVRRKLMKVDEALRPALYGKLTVGTHLEPHLLDTMRSLVNSDRWKINEERSRLWYATDGLFLIWESASREMLDALRAKRVDGVPDNAETLLEILRNSGIVDKNDSTGEGLFLVQPPNGKRALAAVRLTKPDSILQGKDVTPLAQGLYGAVGVQPVAPAKPSSKKSAQEPAITKGQATLFDNAKLDTGAASKGTVDTSTGEITFETAAAAQPTPAPLQESKLAPSVVPTQAALAQPVPATTEALGAESTDEVTGDVQRILLSKLSPLAAAFIRAILAQTPESENQIRFGSGLEGFCFLYDDALALGIDVNAVLESLSANGMIWAPPDKPRKKWHKMTIGGLTGQWVVIKSHAAKDLGLPHELKATRE